MRNLTSKHSIQIRSKHYSKVLQLSVRMVAILYLWNNQDGMLHMVVYKCFTDVITIRIHIKIILIKINAQHVLNFCPKKWCRYGILAVIYITFDWN